MNNKEIAIELFKNVLQFSGKVNWNLTNMTLFIIIKRKLIRKNNIVKHKLSKFILDKKFGRIERVKKPKIS